METHIIFTRSLVVYFFKSRTKQTLFLLKAGAHLRRGNNEPWPYDAASAQLWTAHVYHTPSTNRNKLCLLPRFDVPTTDGSVYAMHKAIASGWCAVHTTRAEASSVLPRLKCVPAFTLPMLPNGECYSFFVHFFLHLSFFRGVHTRSDNKVSGLRSENREKGVQKK